MEINRSFSSVFLFGIIICTSDNGAAALKPTDIVGRNLDVPPFGWIGHVGIATAGYVWETASYVVESLNEPLVLQINTLANFKSRTPYWGAKYGINATDTTGTRIINEGAFQTSLKCAEYTITVQWKPGTGQWGVPQTCPKFRCDTFVNYLYWWGGYTLPTFSPSGSPYPNNTLPRMIFNYFPYARNEHFQSVITPDVSSIVPLRELVNINQASIEQLEEMSFLEFTQAVDLPPGILTKKGIDKILNFSDDLTLSSEKRLFLLDKLGFVVNVNMLPKLIKLYYKYEKDEALSHMILRDTQDIYQQEKLLIKYPQERNLLKNFYTNLLLNSNLSAKAAPIVIRGFSSLSTTEEIFANKDKLDQLINSDVIEVSIGIALKIALAFHSKKLEHYYIPDIINSLEREDKPSLDILFAGAIVGKLSNQALNSLQVKHKEQIRNYLSSIKFKFDTKISKSTDDIILPQSLGIWLEAFALVSSASYDDAAHYIGEYLHSIKTEEHKKYIFGFSNSEYMKKAFNTEPVLIDFKKNNNEFYKNTVGYQNDKR